MMCALSVCHRISPEDDDVGNFAIVAGKPVAEWMASPRPVLSMKMLCKLLAFIHLLWTLVNESVYCLRPLTLVGNIDIPMVIYIEAQLSTSTQSYGYGK